MIDMETEEYSSQDDQDWEDYQEEDSAVDSCRSLFDSHVLPTVEAALRYDAERFHFSLPRFRRQMDMDEIETIMCINFIRSRRETGVESVSLLKDALSKGVRPWKMDEFMTPVIENDALLLYDWNEVVPGQTDRDHLSGNAQQHNEEISQLKVKLEALVQENAVLCSTVRELAQYMPQELSAEITKRFDGSSTPVGPQLGTLSTGRAAPRRASLLDTQVPGLNRKDQADRDYFNSYSHFGIHKEMLMDKVRTEAYREAIEGNPGLIQNATVLDVGCGTGILSLFAARAGAQTVLGVEGSATMAGHATRIVEANGLAQGQGGPVMIVGGQMEAIQALPTDKVDVIVSEWMGYTLLFEAMLDSVLYARDRWLRPGGAMLPDIASLYIAGATQNAIRTSFWGDVYGFSMEPIAQSIQEASQSTALITEVNAADIVTDTVLVQQFDLVTMAPENGEFSTDFVLHGQSQAIAATCAALVVWFDVEFSPRFCKQAPCKLSTSPYSHQTHWAQTVLPLREPVAASVGLPIEGRLSVARSKAHRSLEVSVEYGSSSTSHPEGAGFRHASSYRLAVLQ